MRGQKSNKAWGGSVVIFVLLLACTGGGAPQKCNTSNCDLDGDGFNGKVGVKVATNEFGFWRFQAQECYAAVYDCNDIDPAIFPGAVEVCDGQDDNCDGEIPADEVDQDGDGSLACQDCDDTNPLLYPAAPEICDGIDNNCNGQIDEGALINFFQDLDGDGMGTPGYSVSACAGPPGFVANYDDCDDANPLAYAGAPEICDGVDNNCDGQIDEGVKTEYFLDQDGDGSGTPAYSVSACAAPPGFAPDYDDCDDTNPNAWSSCATCLDGDGDGWFVGCDVYWSVNGPDCNDVSFLTNYGLAEVCDGIDNNCDGEMLPGEMLDQDGDGALACADCNDNDDAVYPGATETCNGLDDDCDGLMPADETTDADGDGVAACMDCNENGSKCAQIVAPPSLGYARVTLIEASAGLSSAVYMVGPPLSSLLFVESLQHIGESTTRAVAPGPLTFYIEVHGESWGLGIYDHYSDSQFVVITQLTANSYRVGFEDLPAYRADWDFNDVVIKVELLP